MKRRIPESWLSAYLDGELDADRESIVAKLAAKHPAIARRLDELRRINAAVGSLPKAKLAGNARLQLWSTVLEHSDVRDAEASAVSACLDGELSPSQSELVEARTTNEELLAANQFLEIGDALRDLPRVFAPADAVAAALAHIKVEIAEGAQAAAELRRLPRVSAPSELLEQAINDVKPLHPTPTPSSWFARRREGWTTGLAAALLTGVALAVYSTSPNRTPLGEGTLLADAAKESRSIATLANVTDIKAAPVPASKRKSTPVVVNVPQVPLAKENDAIVDPRWMPELVSGERKLPPELPKKMLEYIRPGAKFDVPGTTITFLCLDVQRMKERVQIVLLKSKSSVGELNVRTKEEKEGVLVSVELEATPSQMSEFLAELKLAEDSRRLVADMDVYVPKTKVEEKSETVDVEMPRVLANVRPEAVPDSTPPKAPDVKVAAAPKESPAVKELAPDEPRQYLLVFRRQEPTVEGKKKS